MKGKRKKSVLIGLSGGVDSAVSAHLLKKQGYQVTAVFLKMFSDTKDPITSECRWISDYKEAQKIANFLNIPLIKLDYEKSYKSQVLNPMFSDYKSGLTPNPDISCNTIIKFPLLLKEAKKRKINFIATGHYARIKKDKKRYHLLQGLDKNKDQSYFLAELNQSILSKTLFPIGRLTKKQVRHLAKSINLSNHNRESTSGLCFVGNINFQFFLKRKLKIKKGIVKDTENNILGTHNGIGFYTIGQKALPSIGINIKKPNLLASKKYYIIDKIKVKNELIVAPEGHPSLFTNKINIRNLKLINNNSKLSNLSARIRHLGKLYPGKLVKNTFITKTPISLPAPGQYLVIYKGQELIGSGIIG
ncbi:MAG: tRNA 2-thiouridine(34) synthase MnmA [Nanoarchaeota archaeon]